MPLGHAPTPARDEALASVDALHLILTQLLDINKVQAAAAVCKAWHRACHLIKGWRVVGRKKHIISSHHEAAHRWSYGAGGPCFVVTLPRPVAGNPPHPLRRENGAAIFYEAGDSLSMFVIDISDGRTLDTITLPVVWRWGNSVANVFTTLPDSDSSSLLVEMGVCGQDPCPTLFVATQTELCSISFRGEGDRLAKLRLEKVSYYTPDKEWHGMCLFKNRIYIADDEKVLCYPVVTAQEGMHNPTVLFKLPEKDFPFGSPGFDSIDCDERHIALTCSGKDLVYLIDHDGHAVQEYSGGGSLVTPSAAVLSPRHIFVIDSASDDDRLVVLCRQSGAPLQSMRFGQTAVANIRSISFTPDQRHLLLGDAYHRSVHVLSVSAHVTTAEDCICAHPGQKTAPHALRGHGDGTLAQLEQLLSLHGDSNTPPAREFEYSDDNEWQLALFASDQFYNVECPRERMWMALCALLFAQPAARSFLGIPPHVEERFWATERFFLGTTPLASGASGLPMDRRGLRQLTLGSKPVWQWALGGKKKMK